MVDSLPKHQERARRAKYYTYILVLALWFGVFLIAIWFLHPILTGHIPVFVFSKGPSNFQVADNVRFFGMVEDVQTTPIFGTHVHMITLGGLEKTYIVAPREIGRGEWVMVDGYIFGGGPIGAVVIGVENAQQLSVEANVVSYSMIPLFTGIGLLVLGAVMGIIVLICALLQIHMFG